MKIDWQQTTLGQVIELKRGYDLPQQSRRAGKYPLVSSSGITDYHDEPMAKGPGVVTGRYGTIGQVFFIDKDFWPLNTTLYVKDFKGNDPRFISYFLRTLDFLAYSDKAAVPGINRNHLHQARVLLPPLREQRAIAHILGSLDDKIELNRQMNQTLEEMARAIFKSWFVDFDPVHAKARGEQPTGMDAATAALFPDSFEDTELGPVPSGWKVERLEKHIEVARGLSYKGQGLADHGVPLHNLNSIYEGGGYKNEGIKFYTGEYQERHKVKPGELIVANTEQGFDQLLIAYPAIVPERFGNWGLFSHHIYRIRPLEQSLLTNLYLYYQLKMPAYHQLVAGYANGTTVNMLPLDGLQVPLTLVPTRELVQQFNNTVAPLLELIETNIDHLMTLADLRDTLLPKLMSGELRVPEAAETVEAA